MTNTPETRIDVNADLFRIAAMCRSTEETRVYLTGVYIEPHPHGGASLVATDGHRLICIRDESGAIDGPPAIVRLDKPLLTAAKHKITRSRPAGLDNPAPRLKLEGAAARVETADGQTVSQQHAIVDGTFPDWRRVLPKFDVAAEKQIADAFNPRYVADFAAIAAALKASDDGQSPAMRVLSAKTGLPALVDFGSTRAFGVLMPMRSAITPPRVLTAIAGIDVPTPAPAEPETVGA